jgi:hypothetical protein
MTPGGRWPAPGVCQRCRDAAASTRLHFTLNRTSNFCMVLDGTWSGVNFDGQLVGVNLGFAYLFDASFIGVPFSETIPAGRYEFTLGQRCTARLAPLTMEGEQTGDVTYDIAIEQ